MRPYRDKPICDETYTVVTYVKKFIRDNIVCLELFWLE